MAIWPTTYPHGGVVLKGVDLRRAVMHAAVDHSIAQPLFLEQLLDGAYLRQEARDDHQLVVSFSALSIRSESASSLAVETCCVGVGIVVSYETARELREPQQARHTLVTVTAALGKLRVAVLHQLAVGAQGGGFQVHALHGIRRLRQVETLALVARKAMLCSFSVNSASMLRFITGVWLP